MKNKIFPIVLAFIFLQFTGWVHGAIPASERAALIALYNSTNGDNWNLEHCYSLADGFGWKTPPLDTDGFAMPGTEGNWCGIAVEDDHVTYITLPGYELSGSIPSQLGNLKNLKELFLNVNQLRGSIPSQLGDLSNLEILYLEQNHLSGGIPSQLGNLKNLLYLALSNNQLSGSIPSQLGNLTNLEELTLGGNPLSGGIPSELCNLSNLTSLGLSNTQLSGSIPPQLGNLSKLRQLTLGFNQLSGSIPPQLGNLSNLEFLYLGQNQLSGSIPSQLGNLNKLTHLMLRNNQLSGSIPSQLGNLSNLGILYLDSNQLSGSIPSQLGNLSKLITLWLRDNQLSGEIPSSFTNLTNIISSDNLEIGDNCLSATDPTLRAWLNSHDPDWEAHQNQCNGGITMPIVTTKSVTSITQNSAICGGNVTSDGGATVTVRGVCWSKAIYPTIDNSKTTNGTGTGSFTSTITGLTANTTYHVRAYATNSKGTSYGENISFKTTGSTTTTLSGRLRIENRNGDPWEIKVLADSYIYINGVREKINGDGTYNSTGSHLTVGKSISVATELNYYDHITVSNFINSAPNDNKKLRTSIWQGSTTIKPGINTLNIDYHPPVFLIHGIISGWKTWNIWAEELLKSGHIVFTPNHNYVQRNIHIPFTKKDEALEILDQYTSDIFGLFSNIQIWQQSSPDVTFICHSEGGVVMRAFVNEYPGIAKKIKKIYTLGTPHSGTDLFGAGRYDLNRDKMIAFNIKYQNFHNVPVYAISGHGLRNPFGENNCSKATDGIVFWIAFDSDIRNLSPFKIVIQQEENSLHYTTTPGGNFEGFSPEYTDNDHHFCFEHSNLIDDGMCAILTNTIIPLIEDRPIIKSDSCNGSWDTSLNSTTSESIDSPILTDEFFLSSNSSKSVQVTISSTESATFAAFSDRMDIELSLTDPTGKEITSNNYSSNTTIKYSKTKWGVQYSITNPKSGTWKVKVTAKNTDDLVIVGVYEKMTWGIRGVSNKTEYAPNSQVVLNAKIEGASSGVNITNFQVTIYNNQQVEISTITLYDDGKHNDKNAGDGIYGNAYNTPSQGGYYRLKFHAESSSKEQKENSWGYTVTAPSAPTEIVLSRSKLYFGSSGQSSTSDQSILISNKGSGTLNWGASSNASWLTVSPSSGTGDSAVSVSVNPTGLSSGNYSGTITITDSNASNSPQSISAELQVYNQGSTTVPFGEFATPVEGASTYSSVPVTGWALDDVGVAGVKIYNGDSYIGDAIFVEGARPDVQTAFPDFPNSYKAGWGYMLLTHFLPGGGNGTYTLVAKAVDMEGNEVVFGSKTITIDNAHAVKPFGAIDTPTQGGTAMGSSFVNWGWVLTPQPNSIATNGSTINVWVDGVAKGHPVYNTYRTDIATLFPGYANSSGAIGYFYLDTTKYSNGVHTIFWIASDNGGNSDGIGSRYFTIQNSSTDNAQDGTTSAIKMNLQQIAALTGDFSVPITFSKGFSADNECQELPMDENGNSRLVIKELERVELQLGEKYADIQGYLISGNTLNKLPIGSTLDAKSGAFSWSPGPGFLGRYFFVFVLTDANRQSFKKSIEITIEPKFNGAQ